MESSKIQISMSSRRLGSPCADLIQCKENIWPRDIFNKKTPSDPFLMVNSTGLNYMVPPPFCPNVSVYTMMVSRTVKVLKMYTVCRLTNQPTQPCTCWQKTQLCHRQWILFLTAMQAAWTSGFPWFLFPCEPIGRRWKMLHTQWICVTVEELWG